MTKAQSDKNCEALRLTCSELADHFEKCMDGSSLHATLIERGIIAEALRAYAPSHVAPKRYRPTVHGTMLEDEGGDWVPYSPVSTTPQKPEPLAYAVTQPKGEEFDYLVFPDYGEAEAHVADASDEREIIPLFPASALSATPLLTLDTAERVCFYEQEFYVLSNFSSFKVNWMGVIFNTSEHAYHWTRFPHGSPEQQVILESASAHDAFRFAQTHKSSQRADWDTVKVQAMREILVRKVEQHEYVRRKLLETGDRELVENSWRDPFWGWGPNRDGKNMLGKLWMEIRADLRRPDGGKA